MCRTNTTPGKSQARVKGEAHGACQHRDSRQGGTRARSKSTLNCVVSPRFRVGRSQERRNAPRTGLLLAPRVGDLPRSRSVMQN